MLDNDRQRREVDAARRVEEYLERQTAEAPPLTNEQWATLAELLEPVRIKPPQRSPAALDGGKVA